MKAALPQMWMGTGVGREGQPRGKERQQRSRCPLAPGTALPAPSEPLREHPPPWGTHWDPKSQPAVSGHRSNCRLWHRINYLPGCSLLAGATGNHQAILL